MRQRLAGAAAGVGRVVRGLWPDRNPLRRGVDRIEAVILAGLAVAFLAGAPLAAIMAAHLAHGAASSATAAEPFRHQERAVLLANASLVVDSGYWATAPARWPGPGGAERTGTVWVPAGAEAGSTVLVWVDAAGRLTDPPLASSQVEGQAVMAAILAPVMLALLLAGAGMLVRAVVDRRRVAAWDADWQATGPQWTRHHG